MNITSIEIYHLHMPLNFDFITAKTVLRHRDTLIIKVKDKQGNQGFGEVVAFMDPFYTAETLESALHFLLTIAIPEIQKHPLSHPIDIHSRFTQYAKKFPMALAGLENALLDLYTKNKNENLISYLFEEALKHTVPVGMVFGDLPLEILCQKIEENIALDFSRVPQCKRFKIKIKPKNACKEKEMTSFEKLKFLTERFPHVQFLADANCYFPLESAKEIQEYDALNLLCIEEPFAIESLSDYRMLDCKIKTPLCFDESIQNREAVEFAYNLGVLQMINLKIGRMGGLYPIKHIIEFCREKKIPFWIGSMVESGISKILHVQLSALEGNCMAGDLSDSQRYFKKDIILPEITAQNGAIPVPNGDGIGVEVDEKTLREYCFRTWHFSV